MNAGTAWSNQISSQKFIVEKYLEKNKQLFAPFTNLLKRVERDDLGMFFCVDIEPFN